jgi:hypothetical protein
MVSFTPFLGVLFTYFNQVMEASAIRDYKPAFPLPSLMEKGSASEQPTRPISTDTLPGNMRRPNPHRKYTTKWFGHAWDTAVEVGRWPRVTYLGAGAIIVGVWIGVMYVFSILLSSVLKPFLALSGCISHTRRSYSSRRMPTRPIFVDFLSVISRVLSVPKVHCASLILQSGVSVSVTDV